MANELVTADAQNFATGHIDQNRLPLLIGHQHPIRNTLEDGLHFGRVHLFLAQHAPHPLRLVADEQI